MNTTVRQSPITSTSAAFIYGKLLSNPNALNDIDSSDIVKSLFGISVNEPTAIDITEAMVKSMSQEDQVTIREMMYDQGTVGLIWRFVTKKKFMLELSKIPYKNHNILSLTLVVVNKPKIAEELPSMTVRELVRYGFDGVTFFDRRARSIDYGRHSIELLNKLHDEAVSNLENKYLAEPAVPKTTICKITCVGKVVNVTTDGNKLIFSNALSGEKYFFIESEFLCKQNLQGNHVLYNPMDFVYEGKDNEEEILALINAAFEEPPAVPDPEPTVIFAKDSVVHIGYSDTNDNNVVYITELNFDTPEQGGQAEVLGTTPPTKAGRYKVLANISDKMIEGCASISDLMEYLELVELDDEVIVPKDTVIVLGLINYSADKQKTTVELFTDESQKLVYVPTLNCHVDQFGPYKVKEDLMASHIADSAALTAFYLRSLEFVGKKIILHAGDEIEIEKKSPDSIRVTCKKDLCSTWFDLTSPEFEDGEFIIGKFTCKSDLDEDTASDVTKFLKYYDDELDLIEGKFTVAINEEDLAKHKKQYELPETPQAPSTEEVVEVAKKVLDVARETGATSVDMTVNNEVVGTVEVPPPPAVEEQPTEPEQSKEEETIMNNIKVSDKLEVVSDQLKTALTDLLKNNPGMDTAELTLALKKETDIDEIAVKFENDEWLIDYVEAKPAEPEPVQQVETVKSIDLNDINNQYALLRGLFGVTDPAITHLEKFLKAHLTAENNAGYLATGTFPTEVTISYTEKPYDVTYSIVKFKDGRFYRIYAAITNMGLSEQGYIATKNIPNRWVRLGHDIQSNAFRMERRGSRY